MDQAHGGISQSADFEDVKGGWSSAGSRRTSTRRADAVANALLQSTRSRQQTPPLPGRTGKANASSGAVRTASSAARRATRLEQEMGYGPAHGRRGAPANVSAVTGRPLQKRDPRAMRPWPCRAASRRRDKQRDARHRRAGQDRGRRGARPPSHPRSRNSRDSRDRSGPAWPSVNHSPWLLKDRGVTSHTPRHRYVLFLLVRDDATP